MSWSGAVNHIEFFNSASNWGSAQLIQLANQDEQLIIAAVDDLYANSATMRSILDAYVLGGGVMRIGGVSSGNVAAQYVSGGYSFTGYNLGDIAQFMYFNSIGQFVPEDARLTIAHELIHDILGLNDVIDTEANLNSTDFDHLGDTVRLQNAIASELGLQANHQVSYGGALDASHPYYSSFVGGQSYSEGNAVDYVRIGDPFTIDDNLDNSNRTDASRDLIFGLVGDDILKGGDGNDYLYGGEGSDQLDGGDDNDVLYGNENDDSIQGGAGEDRLYGGEGDDELDGGAGDDLFQHEAGNDIFTGGDGGDVLNYGTAGGLFEINGASDGIREFLNIGVGGSDLDRAYSIERILLTTGADIVTLGSLDGASTSTRIDALDGGGGVDQLDLSDLSHGVVFRNGAVLKSGGLKVLGLGDGIGHDNFEVLIGTDQDDLLDDSNAYQDVFLGAGDDTVINAGSGTRIWGGDGADSFVLMDNVLIEDASSEDRISYMGVFDLTGGLRWSYDTPYAMHVSQVVGYGINGEGELVIHDFVRNRDMFVANYVGGPEAPYQTAGIYVAQASIGAYRLLDAPKGMSGQMDLLDFVMGPLMKAAFGTTWNGADPLVLDLDGDGLELTGRSYASPVFDIDGDGYGEHTGWARGGDGFLVLDADEDGEISDVGEMFGGAGLSGFDELAAHDVNADGVIDASDAVFADLQVWRDDNQNMQVDAGELMSLDELDITSISLTTGAPSSASQYENDITAQGTFVRGGVTQNLYDVTFLVDNRRTEFLGDTTVSTAAAALPNLKGYGTLTDLHVAMTLDPTLQGVVASAAAAMTSPDLAGLRAAAMPALLAWALASPLAGGPGTLQPHDDVHLLTEEVGGQPKVTDFAYFNTTDNCWKLASGRLVHDELGAPILYPTLMQVLADDQDDGTWDVLDGDLLSFMERYTGEVLPLDEEPVDPAGAAGHLSTILDGLWQSVNLLAVRLAFQGGLSGYFPGLEYDVEGDKFAPTTDRHLIPTFEAILTEIDTLVSGRLEALAAWEPILDLIVSDYDQGSGNLNGYGFLFSNIVAAYESVGLSEAIDAVAGALGIPEDLIVTGSGVLTGSSDADLIYLSAGNQTATGGDGPDTFVVGRNFGQDVIDELETSGNHSQDVVRFADIASTEVTAVRDGIDLVITVTATGDELRITDHFDGRLPGLGGGGDLSDDTGVDLIIFADGVTWSAFDVARAVSRNTTGNDTINGTDTVDWLDGGAGDDVLSGGADADAYVYGRGYGDDVIDDDNTHIELGGPDIVVLGEGIEISDLTFFRDGDSDDVRIEVDGETGSLTIVNQFAATYTGPLGKVWLDNVEALSFDDGSALSWEDITDILLQSTSGNDTLYGFSLEDTLDGGAGDDYLSGGNENDTYRFGFGDGHDTVEEHWDNILSGGDDTVLFKDGVTASDVTFSRGAGLEDLRITLSDGSTVDILDQFSATYTGPFGTKWFDRIEAFTFSDTSSVAWDSLFGLILSQESTSGADDLYGFDWNDIIDGGAGDDFLSGGNGDDGYVFGLGSGHDTIDDNETNLLSGSFDYILFNADIAPEDIVLQRGADVEDLEIFVVGADDRLTILNTFAGHAQMGAFGEISEFRFADETVWTIADVRESLLEGAKTSGADVIDGFVTADTLDGGAGDDLLRGRDGADTYLFGRGYDSDIIDDTNWTTWSATDVLRFGTGIAVSDLAVSRDGNDLIIQLTASGAPTDDEVRIVGQFDRWTGDYVEEIRFDDDPLMILDWYDILALYIDQATTAGADHIIGAQSADVLEGGLGADRLEGGDGDDTYIYNLGDGADVIYDLNNNVNYSSIDKIDFGVGIVATQLLLSRVGNDLLIDLNNGGDEITVEDYFFIPQARMEELEFADGTIWHRSEIMGRIMSFPAEIHGTAASETINGTVAGEAIFGHGGADTISGGEGSDTFGYTLGDGSDTITDSSNWASETDRLLFTDIDPDDVTLTKSGTGLRNVQVKVNATGEVITLVDQYYPSYANRGLEEIEFADGTIWNRAQIFEEAWIRGTSAGQSLSGTAGAETLWGGGGNDTLNGGAGADTYVYAAGDGSDTIDDSLAGDNDVLVFTDLDIEDLTFTKGGSVLTYLLIKVVATGETITVKDHFFSTSGGVANIHFADGTIWSRTDIAQAAWIRGTSGNDWINATGAAETLVGGAGDDYLAGSGGSDTYIYALGDGSDEIEDAPTSGVTNVLRFTDLNVSDLTFTKGGSVLTHLLIKVNSTGSVITVNEQFYPISDPDGLDQLIFADGTIWSRTDIAAAAWLRGTAGADSMGGTTGADTFAGGTGADTLTGGSGSDIYVYASGDGADTITEISNTSTDTDMLWLSNLNAADVTLSRTGTGYTKLSVTVNATGEVITVNDQFHATSLYRGVEQLKFANNDVWNKAAIAEAAWIRGTSGNETLTGTSASEGIDGGDGSDTLSGGGGADRLLGGSGADTLTGGTGADTFIFRSGFGTDVIQDFKQTDDDIIEFDNALFSDFNDLLASASQVGADVLVTADVGETVLIKNVLLAQLGASDFHFA